MNKKKEKTTKVILKKDDAALVIRADGIVEFFVREWEGDEVPNAALIVGALAILLSKHDKDLRELIDKGINMLDSYAEEHEKEGAQSEPGKD